MEGQSNIREVNIQGDWAYMRNHIEMTITMPDGKTVRRTGYTLTILRKTAGRWMLSRDANLLTATNWSILHAADLRLIRLSAILLSAWSVAFSSASVSSRTWAQSLRPSSRAQAISVP